MDNDDSDDDDVETFMEEGLTPEGKKLLKSKLTEFLKSLPKKNDGEPNDPVSEIITTTFEDKPDTILKKVEDVNMKLDNLENYKTHIEILFNLLKEKKDNYKGILTKLYNGNWELLIVQKQFGRTQSQIDYDMVKSIIIAKIAIELTKPNNKSKDNNSFESNPTGIITNTATLPRKKLEPTELTNEKFEPTNQKIEEKFNLVFIELGFSQGGGFFSDLKDRLSSGFTKTKNVVSTGYNETKNVIQTGNTALKNFTKKVKQRGFIEKKRLSGILGEGGLFGKIRKYADIISDENMMLFIPNNMSYADLKKEDILNIIKCEKMNTNSNNFAILPTFIIEVVILVLEKGLKSLKNTETTIVSFLENRLIKLKEVLLAKNKRECDKVSTFFKGKTVVNEADCNKAFDYSINRTRCRRLLKTKEKCETRGGKKSNKTKKNRKTIGGAGRILDFIDKNSDTKNGLITTCVLLGILFLACSAALSPLAIVGVFFIGLAMNIQCFVRHDFHFRNVPGKTAVDKEISIIEDTAADETFGVRDDNNLSTAIGTDVVTNVENDKDKETGILCNLVKVADTIVITFTVLCLLILGDMPSLPSSWVFFSNSSGTAITSNKKPVENPKTTYTINTQEDQPINQF